MPDDPKSSQLTGPREGGRPEGGATAERILDVAEAMVQARGFNAFSYADVALALGITRASLHYHFPGKADLGTALIVRYEARFVAALEEISRTNGAAAARLRAYAALYEDVLHEDRMCLCGILAAEFLSLSMPTRAALRHFFDANDAWLVGVLEEGRTLGELAYAAPALDLARMLVGSLEGAMMLARFRGDSTSFANTATHLIAGLLALRADTSAPAVSMENDDRENDDRPPQVLVGRRRLR